MDKSPSSRSRFVLSLLDRSREGPPGITATSKRRFDVYRNNVFVSLTEALEARFPVCLALVGGEFFGAMARRYIELCPPRSPLLMTYGDDLGAFIDTFPPAAPLPYLGDVARLEAALTRAYHAADADPLTVERMASLSSCDWAQSRVTLHPSVQIVRSAFAIVSIWEAHQGGVANRALDRSEPEDALIARPEAEVEVSRLPPGGAVFLSHLERQASFREAADAASAAEPRFELVAALARLITSRILIGIASPGCPTSA
jgi:hypothetical protein